MNPGDPLLDRAAIDNAFRRLGERLARRGVVADIYLFGGAAMALAYDDPHATSTPSSNPTASFSARPERSPSNSASPTGGLNEQASAYVAPGGDASAPRVFDHPGLRVSAASPEHLLAMKVLAARRRDSDDIRFLIERLNLTSVEQVLALCAEVFPDEEVPGRARLILEDAFHAP